MTYMEPNTRPMVSIEGKCPFTAPVCARAGSPVRNVRSDFEQRCLPTPFKNRRKMSRTKAARQVFPTVQRSRKSRRARRT